jgi:hypothetical protein
MCCSQFIERDAEKYTVEEDYLCEPVDAFVKCRVILKRFDFAKAFLLNDDAVHCDFEAVERVA